VALEITGRGYRVIPQLEVAGKFIDIVIEGGQSRLAVECDGEHWHGPEQYEQDMERQRKLERCKWVFYRVRESAFYADKEVALNGLWHLLEERGITPQYGIPSEDVSSEKEVEVQNTSINKIAVGDTVLYIDEEDPDAKREALITHGPSNPDTGEINENTPIAQALLGSSVGEPVEVRLPNRTAYLRIVEIRKRGG
jgi:very-short-patch-repair endonuclease